ncbi:MAG TPA: PaaI family thioesterase [Methanoregulaceae archaeon]|nr:PaaI family thioesterase [Methanoregulaceae archaeon]
MSDRPPTRSLIKPIDEEEADFNRCEFARLLGIEIVDTWPGGARLRMDMTGKRNPIGKVHGGAIFSLADQAFAIAANSGEISQVALTAQISFISPATGTLVAVAEQISQNESGSLYKVTVHEGDRLVATFEGIGVSVRKPE